MRIIPYFFWKLGKMSKNLSSAAVVIGALRVKPNIRLLAPLYSCACTFKEQLYRYAIRAVTRQNLSSGFLTKRDSNQSLPATETSWKIAISHLASLDMIRSKMQITKALISLRGSTGWSAPLLFANPQWQVFSRQGPYVLLIYYWRELNLVFWFTWINLYNYLKIYKLIKLRKRLKSVSRGWNQLKQACKDE